MIELSPLLKPRSIALFIPSDEELAKTVAANLVDSSFGEIFLIGTGTPARNVDRFYRSIDELPLAPDLALICTSAPIAADALAQACVKGAKAAVVMTPDPQGSAPDTPLKRSLREVAARHGCRFLGPDSAGLNMPALGINASWMGARP